MSTDPGLPNACLRPSAQQASSSSNCEDEDAIVLIALFDHKGANKAWPRLFADQKDVVVQSTKAMTSADKGGTSTVLLLLSAKGPIRIGDRLSPDNGIVLYS